MAVQRLALIGADGMLARKVGELAPAGYAVCRYDLPDFNVTDREQVLAEMTRLHPAVIINCAAFTNVDNCETQEELATRVNGDGPGYLAGAAKAVGAVLVHISTDYVFNGRKASPYLETDPVGPLSAYGRSKLAGEQAILASGLERYFIVRTSWLYGPGGKNFVETIVRLAREREEMRIVDDQIGSPTYTGDLATAIFRLLALTDQGSPGKDHGLYGIYHFSNEGQCSWYEFAREILKGASDAGLLLKAERVLPIRTEEYPLPAERPSFSIFSKEKYQRATGAFPPDWRESLVKYMREREI